MKSSNPFAYSIGTRVRDKIFLELLEPQSGERVLDVGCGLGYFIELFNRCGAKCTGIDIDRLCLAYCSDNIPGEYVEVDLANPPYAFAEDWFDKAICTEVLEHIENNGLILQELRRIMKPGAVLVVSTPCLDGIFGTFWKRIGHNHVDSNSYEYHYHKGYTEGTLAKLLERYGFRSQRTEYTMVLGVEVIMGITKILVRQMQLKKIDSQANALSLEGMALWRVYKKLFGSLLLYGKVEQPLARILKGHMIIMKGVLHK